MADVGTAQASSLLKKTDVHGSERFVVRQPLKSTGMDPEDLAKHMGDIKRAQGKTIQDKVDKNLKTIESLTQLKNLTSGLKTSTEQLTNYLGMNSKISNLWQKKEATVLDATGQNAAGLLRVTTGQGTPLRSFSMEVLQMAKADNICATNTFATTDQDLGITGNLSINANNQVYTVALDGLSLDGIASAINTLTPSTQVRMEIMQTTSEGGYQWQMIHQNLSTPIDLTGTDASVITNFFIPPNTLNNGLPNITSQNSLLLKVKYDGQLITRSGSNFISDLIPDTTLEVYAENTGVLKCNVDFDRTSVATGIAEFVKSYNDLRKFVREQTAFDRDKNTPKEDAFLYGNMLTRNEVMDVERTMNMWVKGTPTGTAQTLAAIGLEIGSSSTRTDANGNTIVNSNIEGDLVPDVSTFEKLLYSDKINQVIQVLGNNVNNTNNYFRVYSIPNFSKKSELAGVPVTLTLSNQGGNIVANLSADVPVPNAPSINITAQGNYNNGLVTGPVGSAFEGFSIGCLKGQITNLLNGGQPISTTATSTMGVFSSLDKVAGDYLAYSTGKFDIEIGRLQTENKQLTEKKDKIEKDAVREEERSLRDLQSIREIETMYQQMESMFDTMIKVMTSPQ